MRLRPILLWLAAPLAGCAGTATTDDGRDRRAEVRDTDCVRTALITNWEALDEHNLIVYESRRPYHVELARTCSGLDFATLIGFYDRGGDERICGYGLDRVIVDRLIPEGCTVTAVDELTDEQAADLKRRAEEEKALARPRPRARR